MINSRWLSPISFFFPISFCMIPKKRSLSTPARRSNPKISRAHFGNPLIKRKKKLFSQHRRGVVNGSWIISDHKEKLKFPYSIVNFSAPQLLQSNQEYGWATEQVHSGFKGRVESMNPEESNYKNQWSFEIYWGRYCASLLPFRFQTWTNNFSLTSESLGYFYPLLEY